MPFLVSLALDVSFSYPKLDSGRSNLLVGGLKIQFRLIYIKFTHFFFPILEKIPNLLKLLLPGGGGVDFFVIRSQHTEPVQPSGGSEEIEL